MTFRPEQADAANGFLGSDGCLVVGEVGQAHDGSLGTAHAFIDAIADAGAHAVKFQTHLADAESTVDEPWRVAFSPQDERRYDYWERMEFTEPQWQGLRDRALHRGLKFISSPFSLEAVELLGRVGVDAVKIASGEVGNLPLIEAAVGQGAPVLLSTGMSPVEEIDAAVEVAKGSRGGYAVLQCSSAYPCPPEEVGVNLIPWFRQRYGCPVGLSDHSGTIFPALSAATLGIDVLEIHVTLSREAFGPDVSSSVTTGELRTIVEGLRFIARMRANPVDKDGAAAGREDLRQLFTKSLVTRAALPAGHVLGETDLAAKKPGGGFPPTSLPELIGQRLRRDVDANERLTADHLEPAP